MTDPDPDVYVDMMEHNQADDGIRVLMAMKLRPLSLEWNNPMLMEEILNQQ